MPKVIVKELKEGKISTVASFDFQTSEVEAARRMARQYTEAKFPRKFIRTINFLADGTIQVIIQDRRPQVPGNPNMVWQRPPSSNQGT